MSDPEKIVSALLEDGEPEDPKEFMDRNAEDMLNKWEQIGGDFGDPWVHGGSWFNLFQQEIVHIRGLEGEGIKDKEPWDIELTPEELAHIEAQFLPQDYEDEDARERDKEEAIDSLKMQKSEAFNETVAVPVYRFLDEELGQDDWPDQTLLARQFDAGVWDTLSTAHKWLEVGEYYGFHELDDYPDNFTKAELSKYLGLEL